MTTFAKELTRALRSTRDGEARFRDAALARLTPRGRVPVNAVLTDSALACVLIVVGSFDALSNYFIFNAWVFYVAAGVTVFVLRRREPEMPRPSARGSSRKRRSAVPDRR